jgi:two-component sensor histidine kinase
MTPYYKDLEQLSRSRNFQSANLDDILQEVGTKLTECFQIDRVNIWVFNNHLEEKCLRCIGSYDKLHKTFTKGEILYEKDIPNYFKHLSSDKILVVNDVNDSDITQEIKDGYCKKYEIRAMMDSPIRIEGELKGVLCYEQRNDTRIWTTDEQNFALAVNQVVALALETHERRIAQVKLEKALKEKELLYAEMHHRIKNNLTTLISLLRIQDRQSNNALVHEVLNDCQQRIFSIVKLHEQLYKTGNYKQVDLSRYVYDLLSEFRTTNLTDGKNLILENDIQEGIQIETPKAVTIGLIMNEILNNSQKHAFTTHTPGRLTTKLFTDKDKRILLITDNGKGFETAAKKSGLGLSLVNDLAEQMNAQISIVSSPEKGTSFQLIF